MNEPKRNAETLRFESQVSSNLLITGKRHVSFDGYEFNEGDPFWTLNKNIVVSVRKVLDLLDDNLKFGFTQTILNYAKTSSAAHTNNIVNRMRELLIKTSSSSINESMLINYHSSLGRVNEHHLGSLRGFIYKWYEFGYPGVDVEVVNLLRGWKLRGNIKGDAVKRLDHKEGPLSENELIGFNEAAARAYENGGISISDLALSLLISSTGRRPIQISHMKISDLEYDKKNRKGEPLYVINIPRAKQRASGFREAFTQFAVTQELWALLNAQKLKSIDLVEQLAGFQMQETDRQKIPLFPDLKSLNEMDDASAIREALESDRLHIRALDVTKILQEVAIVGNCISERTGDILEVTSTRFRYTTGTRAARAGWGEMVIAKLLDHTDTQNAGVYIKNIPDHVAALDEAVGHQLAKYARAFQGILVDNEAQARRGSDINSRIQFKGEATATCGSFGACGANVPICCYTCSHFQPWLEGPHEAVYQEMIEERARVLNMTGDEAIAAVNDRTIVAIAEVIQRCRVRREELNKEGLKS